MNNRSKIWIKVFIAVILIILIFVLFNLAGFDFSDVDVNEVKTKIKSFGILAPVIFILLFQIRLLLFLPFSVVSMSAGIIWGWEGLIYILTAVFICATWQFFGARYLARNWVEKIVKGKLESIKERVDKNGFISVILIRLIPNILWDIQNLVLGLTRVNYGSYILATMIGMLPGIFILVFFGDWFVAFSHKPQLRWVIFIAVFMMGLIYWIQSDMKIGDQVKER